MMKDLIVSVQLNCILSKSWLFNPAWPNCHKYMSVKEFMTIFSNSENKTSNIIS